MKKKLLHTKGLLFDFIATKKTFNSLRYSKLKDVCHIILTDKIFATLDEDGQLHIRASIYSIPSVISTAGIIEGPARPREFYIYKQRYDSLGIWPWKEKEVKQKFRGQFINYQDERIKEVIKGYIAQALFFYIIDNPFCNKKCCRLYNAHWQKDLIYSQIKKGTFCKYHRTLLAKIRRTNKEIS